MSISDETLIAYVDGALDSAGRRVVEQAVRHDPDLASKLARHQAVRATRGARVIDLGAVRAIRAGVAVAPQRPWSRANWASLAALLVLGILLGRISADSPWFGGQSNFYSKDGVLLAEGALEQALTHQLARTAPPSSAVKVGMSFLANDGDFCRSFRIERVTTGLACKTGGQWRIAVLADTPGLPSGDYRMAAAELPRAVMDVVEQRIAGRTLDAATEQAALAHGWQGTGASVKPH